MSDKMPEVNAQEVQRRMREIVNIAETLSTNEIMEIIEVNLTALNMKLNAVVASANLLEKFIQDKGLWNEYAAVFKEENEKIADSQTKFFGGEK